jgi:hypothetical protein
LAVVALSLFLTIGFFSCLIYFLLNSKFELALITFAFKVLVDLLLFLPFFYRFKRMKAWLLLPVYQLLFPFYNLLILVLIPFFKPIWKGRKSGVN